jgi:hypothetical protein
MKPLILTGCSIPAFREPDFADLAVDFFFRFVWGEPPSPDELATYLGPRTPEHGPERGRHWSDFAGRMNRSKNSAHQDLGEAGCRRPNSARRFLRTGKTSAGTIRSTAGEAVPTSPVIACGDGIRR